MGLDCSFDAFHGAYSAFNRLRQFVAKSIGGSYPPHEDKGLDVEHWYFPDNYTGDKHKGLHEFFCHSDCDGEISPEMCKLVADELEAELPKMEELAKTFDSAGHIAARGGYIAVVKKFIEGCRTAHEENKPLIFH